MPSRTGCSRASSWSRSASMTPPCCSAPTSIRRSGPSCTGSAAATPSTSASSLAPPPIYRSTSRPRSGRARRSRRAVGQALDRELEALPAEARELAQGAAVAGGTFDVDVAAEAAGMPEPSALETIDVLIESDVLRPTEAPRRFRFRHPIVHHAVYRSASEGRRLAVAPEGRCRTRGTGCSPAGPGPARRGLRPRRRRRRDRRSPQGRRGLVAPGARCCSALV